MNNIETVLSQIELPEEFKFFERNGARSFYSNSSHEKVCYIQFKHQRYIINIPTTASPDLILSLVNEGLEKFQKILNGE
jgi:hypothetical protein